MSLQYIPKTTGQNQPICFQINQTWHEKRKTSTITKMQDNSFSTDRHAAIGQYGICLKITTVPTPTVIVSSQCWQWLDHPSI